MAGPLIISTPPRPIWICGATRGCASSSRAKRAGRALAQHAGHHDPEDPGARTARKPSASAARPVVVMAAANLIDGRAIAAQIQDELAHRIAALKARGCQPGLAFVRVGEDPASKVYVGRKEKACAELGIFSETHVLPETTTEAELLALLARLKRTRACMASSSRRPLPRTSAQAVVYSTVSAGKRRGRLSPGQRRQADAGRPDGFSALHAGGHSRIARALAGARSAAPKSSCWAAATSSANRWPRCSARRTSTPTPP